MNRQYLNLGIVQHFKRETVDPAGTEYLYQPYFQVEHSETGEQMMVYRALYGENKRFVRPMDMFFSEVDHEKYPSIKQKYRFELIRTPLPKQISFVTEEARINGKTMFMHELRDVEGKTKLFLTLTGGDYPRLSCNMGFDDYDTRDLSKEKLNDLLDIIRENGSVFGIKELPPANEDVKFIHRFRIFDGENSTEFFVTDLARYDLTDDSTPESIKQILVLHQSLAGAFRKLRVADRYLALTIE